MRLAVLKPPPADEQTPGHYALRLIGQSRIYHLTKYFGKRVRFTLSKPLAVPRWSTVAITVPTWAPVFAHNAQKDSGKKYQWRASHQNSRCGDASVQNAQQTVGKLALYDCRFKGAQLDYSGRSRRGPPGKAASSAPHPQGSAFGPCMTVPHPRVRAHHGRCKVSRSGRTLPGPCPAI